ncbi:MAG: hypothetical protein ABI461_19025 [Polyangiaceae bacterium]
MRTIVDAVLIEEVSRFSLRFACEDCIHFCERKGCEHGYPLAPRRADLTTQEIVFCKDFEIA